jgi:hypothetical protein
MTNPKYDAAIKLAEIRGYKELRVEQLDQLLELTEMPELTVTESLDAVLNAPQERMNRTLKLLRKQASVGLFNLAKLLETK